MDFKRLVLHEDEALIPPREELDNSSFHMLHLIYSQLTCGWMFELLMMVCNITPCTHMYLRLNPDWTFELLAMTFNKSFNMLYILLAIPVPYAQKDPRFLFEKRRGQPRDFWPLVSTIDGSTLPQDCVEDQLC